MSLGALARKHSTSIMSVMEDDVYLVRLKACQCIAKIGATDVMEHLTASRGVRSDIYSGAKKTSMVRVKTLLSFLSFLTGVSGVLRLMSS